MASKMRFSEFIDLLLARLYELEQQEGGSGAFFDLNAIAKQLTPPVPLQWTLDAGRVLETQALARCIFALGGVCMAQLTGEGRLYVEQEKGTGIIKQYHLAPAQFVVNVSGENNQVAVGSSGVSQEIRIEKQREPAFQLVDQIEAALKGDGSIPESDKKDILTDIDLLRSQLKKREPNRTILAAVLEPLSRIASIGGLVVNLIKLLNP